MRTKLFLAFLSVIVVALVSNLIFEQLITKDFEEYVTGSREDKLYWVLASVEGSYSDGSWDMRSLHEALHWGLMLGFDLKITGPRDEEVISAEHILSGLAPSMRRKMESVVELGSAEGEYEPYPLYAAGREIGTMHVRKLRAALHVTEKETTFKKRGRYFLIVSFAVAGGSAAFLAVFFTLFLSRPLKRMKKAVDALGRGDFSVRVESAARDELGKLAESFNFMAEALEREEALRRHLTSNVAHELRTPLAVMKANVEAMIDGVVSNRDEGLENIRIEVENLIRLVEGIEDVTKAEASFFSGRDYSEIELLSFLRETVRKMDPLAAGKGLAITVVKDRPLMVSADAEKLERILRNIITNAVRNTDSGGIWVDYGKERGEFFVEIRDSGRGIPEEMRDRIFQRFYRGGDSKGLGLGLAIVKELVDAMAGRIELKSRMGEGTTFRIWLPSVVKS